MVYPIYGYGNSVLKQEAQEIEADYKDLKQLVADMFETMYASNGVGQRPKLENLSIDSTQLGKDEEELQKEESEGSFFERREKGFYQSYHARGRSKP